MAKIRILLADDHTLFRQGIRTLISAEADMEVVAEASNGGDAVDRAAEQARSEWEPRSVQNARRATEVMPPKDHRDDFPSN